MKKITQEEFNNLPFDGNVRVCPGHTDYSDIKKFNNICSFGSNCKFGANSYFTDWSSFGESCKFGEKCKFRSDTSFGGYCEFDKHCTFEALNSFGKYSKFKIKCRFGYGCSFARSCTFYQECNFGSNCSFADNCIYKTGCSFEGSYKTFSTTPFISFSGLGSRTKVKTYVWNFETPMVSCGFFFGTVDQFENHIAAQGGDPFYLRFVELAVKKLEHLNS